MTGQAHDMPDDYEWLPNSSRYPMADLGELAARLGSPDRYDRRGEVIFLDDMSHGFSTWHGFQSGTGSSNKISCAYTGASGYSIRCIAGSDGGHYAGIYSYVNVQELNTIGFEVEFSPDQSYESIEISTTQYDGTNYWIYVIRFVLIGNLLQYRTTGGAWVAIATVNPLSTVNTVKHNVKVVADLATHEYKRVLFDRFEYSISGAPPVTGLYSETDTIRFDCKIFGRSGFNDSIYIHQAIVTSNEP